MSRRIVISAIQKMRKGYARIAVHNKEVSIISNNCIGADICHNLGLRFNSPTVNMQFSPDDYIKFINDLPGYLSETLKEGEFFSPEEKYKVRRMYNRNVDELEFPVGRIGDILLFFQHFKSFEEAEESWNRRCKRVNLNDLGIIMIGGSDCIEEMENFSMLDLSYGTKLLFAINCRLNNKEYIPVNVPEGVHFMENQTIFKKYYERNFNSIKWVNSIGLS